MKRFTFTYLPRARKAYQPMQCHHCGAVVDFYGVETHSIWHLSLDDFPRDNPTIIQPSKVVEAVKRDSAPGGWFARSYPVASR